MFGEVAKMFVSVGARTTEFTRGMNHVQSRMTQMSQRMGQIGSTLTKRVTLPLIGIGVAAFKLGKDFETSMSQIVGLVGVAQDQVDAWGKEILEMAPRLAKAPQELADALFFVTSAGFRGAEAMNVLEISAKASAAGLGETKTIADTLTSAVNAYGQENLDAGRAADILTAAVREGKLEASALAPVLGSLLPTASAMGIEFDQVAGMLAVFSRTGTDAAEGATSLSAIMTSLIKPTEGASKVLESAGLNMGQLRDIAMSKPDGLIQVMRMLDQTFEGNDEALAQIVPNIRAFRGVMNALAQDASIVDGVMQGVSESTGAMEHGFSTAADTADFRWNQAITGVKVAMIELWQVLQHDLIPAMETVTEKIGSATEWFRNLEDAQRRAVIQWGLVAVAMGPVVTVGKWVIASIGAIGSALSWLAAHPIVLVIAAIAAIAYAWWKHTDEMLTLTRQLRNYVAAAFDYLVAYIDISWNKIKLTFYGGVQAITDALRPLAWLMPAPWREAFNAMDAIVADKTASITHRIRVLEGNLHSSAQNIQRSLDMIRWAERQVFGTTDTDSEFSLYPVGAPDFSIDTEAIDNITDVAHAYDGIADSAMGAAGAADAVTESMEALRAAELALGILPGELAVGHTGTLRPTTAGTPATAATRGVGSVIDVSGDITVHFTGDGTAFMDNEEWSRAFQDRIADHIRGDDRRVPTQYTRVGATR